MGSGSELLTAGESFVKWQPTPLMEWAKAIGGRGRYSLARSGVPSVTDVREIPGGPFEPALWGHNEEGHEGLKGCIAAMYGEEPANVLLAQGASECNFLIAGAVLAGGGAAVVETPVYEPLLRAIEVWADRVIRLPRRRENGFQPDPDELRRLLANDVRLVVLTDLHNPTHVALEPVRLQEIVATARAAGAIVMIDEVFLPMLRRDHRTHGHEFGAISVNGLDKSWGLDAIRVGWAVGPEEIVSRAYRLNNLLGVHQPYMTEDLAFRILSSCAAVEWLVGRADRANEGRALLDEFVEQTPEVRCVPSDGGISAVVELPDGMNDYELSERLLAKESTVVFPGGYFEYPGALRVSFGGEAEETREGFRRLGQRIRTWS